jgi:hypothetical protein
MSINNPFDRASIPPQQEEVLSPDELRERLRDPSYLPTHEDFSLAFKSEKLYPPEWHDFCFNEENPIFEFLNEEHLRAFGDYLSQRAEELGASEDSPITILEVGAGNGRLTYFLQQKLEAKLPGKVKVIATDSGEWGLKNFFPVETIGHKEALEKYKPKIVVFSWMPYGADFTKDFRAAECVDEYILIGETDAGCCGHEWLTWGYSWFFDDDKLGGKIVPPYIADGFERKELEDVSTHQICRTDLPGLCCHSKTTSFKRKK